MSNPKISRECARTPLGDVEAAHEHTETSRTSTFVDQMGRDISVVAVRSLASDEFAGVVEMYRTFDPAHRTLDLPPTSIDGVRDWLNGLPDGYHVIARHENRVVGHGVLVSTADANCVELAVFVHQTYQHARIGTQLLQTLFRYAENDGVTVVRLEVERTNRDAVALYHRLGFCIEHAGVTEFEMTLTLGGE